MSNFSRGYNARTGERMRSMAEINARYQLCCQKYKQFISCKEDFREQKLMIYSELKTLGWVLGKSEQQISLDANF